jgi:bifunctional DNA-binding transcriptional regulator/antitoxin component of YhaV-PrlF toxin-antitoxin module
MIRTKIQKYKDGQLRFQFPKQIASFFGINGGDYIIWTFSDGQIILKKFEK